LAELPNPVDPTALLEGPDEEMPEGEPVEVVDVELLPAPTGSDETAANDVATTETAKTA
jgi:hypothetical protein